MEYDSPEAAKEFPGLYLADAGQTLEDSIDYDDEDKQKKRKDKKDGKKEKGYAALAGDSSPEEDEADPKSPGRSKKIKPFKLSSTKKKDKTKSLDKVDKVVQEETKKPLEKSKSLGGEKEKKVTEKDKKTLEKERKEETKAAEKQKKEERKLDKEREKKREKEEKERKKEEKKKKSLSGESGGSSAGGVASPSTVEKERGLNLNQALNAFLNAPAPRLIKKDKEGKKSIDLSSSILKLKRSKHSLDESSQSDVPVTVSHQFPEEPEAIVKEIKKYEALLEQTHSQIKSSKKVSKKSEEQLWELQRTLTQLKRKLRSVNALKSTESHPTSSTSSLHPESQHSHTDASDSHSPQSKSSQGSDQVDGCHVMTESIAVPVRDIKSPTSPKTSSDPEVKLDFTQMAASAESVVKQPVALPPPTVLSVEERTVDLDEVDLKHNLDTSKDHKVSRRLSENDSGEPHLASISPEPDVEKVQVQVEVHATNVSPMFSLSDVEDDGSVTPDSQMGSPSGGRVFRTLTFSEDDDEDEVDEVTDISTLSPKNVHEFSRDHRQAIATSLMTTTAGDPFQMPIFETEEYIALENKALSQFNERLRKEISSEENDIDTLMEQLVMMGNEGVDIDAPEIELDLDRFDNDEILSLWQITKLENEALNERVDQLRQMVAVSKLEEFQLETRVRYLESLHSKIQKRNSSASS